MFFYYDVCEVMYTYRISDIYGFFLNSVRIKYNLNYTYLKDLGSSSRVNLFLKYLNNKIG